MKINKTYLLVALFFAGTAVALGAFGAHGLAKVFSEKQMATFDTAVRYQMYHGLALLALSVAGAAFKLKHWRIGQGLLVAGTCVFSMSLYAYLATGIKGFAMITPLGGSALILGWLWLFVGAWKGNRDD